MTASRRWSSATGSFRRASAAPNARSSSGLAASAGSTVDSRKNFSLPFSSLMSRVSGSIAFNAAAAGLSASVAEKVVEPMVTFIVLPA